MHNNHDILATETVTHSAAVRLGEHIRIARKENRMTIQDAAEKIGRPREWLNRVELGYSEQGEYGPPSLSDMHTIIDTFGRDNFGITKAELLQIAEQAIHDFREHRTTTKQQRRQSFGKLTQTEIIIGEKQIMEAIEDLINEQHSDAIIRNTGIKAPGNYNRLTKQWGRYRHQLGDFLERNPRALFKRVESVSSISQLEKAKEADSKLKGNRSLEDTHNAKIKFYKHNPLQMHVLIGQREAILALPQVSGQSGSNIALLIRDKVFVEALRVWYDEVLWDAPGDSYHVDFQRFEESFERIAGMLNVRT